MTRSPARRILGWIGKLLLAVILGALVLEGAVRFLLFSDMASSWNVARLLRKPQRFATYTEDEYWILQHRFLDPDCVKGPNGYDEQLGWVGTTVVPGTYLHAGSPPSPELRPILLYGDSFAQCTTPESDCFQGLVKRSNLSTRYALVNFGVGGYGLDQIYMLLHRSIDQYVERKPLVLVSLLVDGDLDRCLLTLYGCSKPMLVLEDRNLRPFQQRVPTCKEYLEHTSFRFPSLAARLLIYSTDFFPMSWRRAVSRQQEKNYTRIALTRKLLEEIHADLERRDLCHVFVLFYTEMNVRDPKHEAAADELVKTTLDGLGEHWLDMREALLADCQRTGRPITEYYDQLQPPMGHPTELGNQAMLDAMIAGLERYCGLVRSDLTLSPGNMAKVELRGPEALARYSDTIRSPLPGGTETRRVVLRVGSEGPTEIQYDLNGVVRTFRCTVRSTPFADEKDSPATMRLQALVDGKEVYSRAIAHGEPQFDVALDLAGKRGLVLRLDDNGDGIRHDALVLCDPIFE